MLLLLSVKNDYHRRRSIIFRIGLLVPFLQRVDGLTMPLHIKPNTSDCSMPVNSIQMRPTPYFCGYSVRGSSEAIVEDNRIIIFMSIFSLTINEFTSFVIPSLLSPVFSYCNSSSSLSTSILAFFFYPTLSLTAD